MEETQTEAEETQTGAKFTLHLYHQSIRLFKLHTFQMQSPNLIRVSFLQTAILFCMNAFVLT